MLKEYSHGDVAFDVPISWVVSETEGTVEMVDELARGALHLSFLKRTTLSPPQDDDACQLVENFASKSGLVLQGNLNASVYSSEARAIGRFHPQTPTAETPLHWLLASIVWQDSAVRASYCTDSDTNDLIQSAAEVVRSIRSFKRS